jgi:hypothetical protein
MSKIVVVGVTSADSREEEMRKIARNRPTRMNASLKTFRRDVGINSSDGAKGKGGASKSRSQC